MPHLGPVGRGEGASEGTSDGEGDALFAACKAAAEADAIWYAKAAISPPRKLSFAAAVDVGTEEVAVTWVLPPLKLLEPAAAAASDTAKADEEVRTLVGEEGIIADEEKLAVALTLPIAAARPDAPGPIPTADERILSKKAINA